MPRKANGRHAASTQHDAPNDQTQANTTSYYNICQTHCAYDSILAELEEAAIVPLAALLCSDASPREIVRRLRLNVAIRMLLDAIAESEAPAW